MSIILKNNNKSRIFQRHKAQLDFLNFTSIDDKQVAQTSYLLKYNYLLMQKLQFQNFLWLDYYDSNCKVVNELLPYSLKNKFSDYFFLIKDMEILQHPETVLYWKNFNKNIFVKPLLETFMLNDMGKTNVNSFLRNANQANSSSNFQYSSSLFKRSFQYDDIVDFYIQNKSNFVLRNNLFNYSHTSGLSKKWDQARYLFLLSNSHYVIVKNNCDFSVNGIVDVDSSLDLTYIV